MLISYSSVEGGRVNFGLRLNSRLSSGMAGASNGLLCVEEQPHFGLRVLLEFLDHQLAAPRGGGPMNSLKRVTVNVFAHAGRVGSYVHGLAANDCPARQQTGRRKKG